MVENMIKALFFDFGQTLVNSADGFRAAEKNAKTAICSDLFAGSQCTSDETFLAEYRKIRKTFHEISNFSRPAIWRAVYLFFGREPIEARLEAWETQYWETVKANTTPFPETIQVLQTLSEKYRLGLITNTQGQKRAGNHRIALFPELEHFFEHVIVAGEEGVLAKPDPMPFRMCLEKFHLAAHECVHVGDDWRIDICGSQDSHIRPIWLQHRSVKRNWPQVDTAAPVIQTLDPLMDLHGLLNRAYRFFDPPCFESMRE
jgi:HAD superfamily hydrolase (TIGR01549 family)